VRADRQHRSPEPLRPVNLMARDRSEDREVIVSQRLIVSLCAGWPVVVITALASRAALVSSGLSAAEIGGWIFLAVAPVLTGLLLVRGRSTPPIAQVLYDVEHAGANAPQGPEATSRG
jgi:hypothetical protein